MSSLSTVERLSIQPLIRVRCVGMLPSPLKALVWFWLIDETLSANLVYQDDHEIGSTTPSDEAMTKIMTLVMIKCLNLEKKKEKNKRLNAKV